MKNKVGSYFNSGVIVPFFRVIEDDYTGFVYDLQVAEGASFTSPYIVYHNCGSLNDMWVELRQICSNIGIKAWREFEEFITSNQPLPDELVDWIKRALVWKATDYGTETRETAKWIIYSHRELLEDEKIKYGLKHPPKMSEEDEIEAYIKSSYFQVLNRHPDRGGLEAYKKEILRGTIKKEDLPKILAASKEYSEKKMLGEEEKEQVKVQIPVDVNVQLNEQIFREAMMKSETWNEVIKPRLDVGKFVLENIQDKEKFLEKFYKGEVKPEDVIKEEWR